MKQQYLFSLFFLLLLLSQSFQTFSDEGVPTGATHLYERKFAGALCEGVQGLSCVVSSVRHMFIYNETELYFTNGFTNSINKYNLQTKVVETIVGTGSYEKIPLVTQSLSTAAKDTNIGTPTSLAVYQGFVYFTTYENADMIFRVKSDGSGFISVFSGVSGVTGYNPAENYKRFATLSSPKYLNVYPNGDLIFFDSGSCTIRNISGVFIKTIAGTGACNLNENNTLSLGVSAMTLSTNQVLYIATNDGVIRKWDGSKFIPIFTANGEVSSIAADPFSIYFTTDSNELSYFSFSSGTIVVLLGPNQGQTADGMLISGAKTNSPTALTISSKSTSSIFFAENGNGRIRMIDTERLSTLVGYLTSTNYPTPVIPTKMVLVNSTLFVVDTYNGQISKIDVSTGKSSLMTVVYSVSGIAAINNAVYVCATQSNVVYKIESSQVVRFAGNGTFSSTGDGKLANYSTIANPLALASDSSGNLYILSTNIIRKVSKNGIISTFFTYLSGGLNDIYINAIDEILISDSNGYVFQLSCTGAFCGLNQLAGIQNNYARSTGFDNPLNVAISPLTISALSNLNTGNWFTLLISEPSYISVVSKGFIYPLVYNAKNSPLVNLQTIRVNGFAVNQTSGVIYVSGPYGISTLTPYTLPKEMCPCSGNGICYSYSPETCLCDSGWGGSKCSIPTCSGILATSSQACNGQGVCTNPDSCTCKSGYLGSRCEIPFCVGSTSNANFTCSDSTQTSNNETLTKKEIIVEVVQTVSDLNSKNLTFTTIENIGIVFPSNFSTYISNSDSQISNIPITIVSAAVDSSKSTNATESLKLVVSPVITLSLFTNSSMKISVKNLEKPIELLFSNIQFPKKEGNSGISAYSNLTCVFFDTILNDWSNEGISSQIISLQNSDSQFVSLSIKCETKHLTSFAVIDLNYKKQVSTGNKMPTYESEWGVVLSRMTDGEIIAIAVSLGGSCLILVTLIVLITAVCIIVSKRKKKNSNFGTI